MAASIQQIRDLLKTYNQTKIEFEQALIEERLPQMINLGHDIII